ncbi:MAG TPA: amidase [Bacteroidales bacterium]|nr:amidase [Bacteroidales bacterium]
MIKSLSFRFSTLFLLAILCLSGCKSSADKQVQKEPDNKWIEEYTIPRLQQGYYESRYTVKDIVNIYLKRIEEIDRNGPSLNSIITINPDAIQIAEQLDRELTAGKIKGSLFGVPVVLKDNIDTHDKMPTTAGATALRNSFPQKDSYVAKKLREAGAVIIGKANMSEWANFRSSMSSSGWSGVGGQTKNPYVLDRNPCGSSSGSAVSVSANLCMIAIGTETNGSIMCPSNNNGIVGIKPTVGLVSRSGIIPISFTQDTPGPMGRTVEDVAIALGALTGIDSTDSKTLAHVSNAPIDYLNFLKKDGLSGKRIGLYKKAMGFSDKVDTLMFKAIAYMKANGAEVIEVDIPKTEDLGDAALNVLLYEFKDGLNKYFARLGNEAPVKSLKDLIEFNKHDTIELEYFNQRLLEMAEEKGDLESAEYKKALVKMLKATRENGIDMVMDRYKLDAIVAPTGSPAWKTDLLLGDRSSQGSSSFPAKAGYPAITVPMGFINDLPVGITFFGKAWSEPLLFEIAYSYEQGTMYRKTPKYKVSD